MASWWKIVAGVAAGGAVATSLYRHACRSLDDKQISILYNPPALAEGHHDHHVVMSLADGCIRGWVDNPGHDHAIVYYGGSSEQVELRRPMLQDKFPNHTLYTVPYRGFGANNQWKPAENILKHDAETLFDLVRGRHQTVSVIGRSLGTSMAMHVSARKEVQRLALITPFSSVLRIAQTRYSWAPVKRILKDHHEVWKDAKHVQTPVLACLAGSDTITPHQFWRELLPHFSTEVTTFVDEPSDHNSIAFSHPTWDTIANFLAPHP